MAGPGSGKKKKAVTPRKLDVRKLSLRTGARGKSGRGRAVRAAEVTFCDCKIQKGDRKGETTGRAYLRIAMDYKLNDPFKAACEAAPFIGDRKFRREDDATWHVGFTAPEMWSAWLAKVPDDNAFKVAFVGKEIAVSESYVAPRIDVCTLDDGKLMLNVEPPNGLYHHRGVLEAFTFTRDVAGVSGLERYISNEAMLPGAAIELLNGAGFVLSEANVATATWKDLRGVGETTDGGGATEEEENDDDADEEP